ncbi:MAG: hypothetical protein ACYDDF_07675 [Thermoplasmatota archaeon]
MRSFPVLGAGVLSVVAIIVATGTAAAAIFLAYNGTSSLTNGVIPAPIEFAPGADSGPSAYVPAFSVSANFTTFSATIRGVAESTLTVGDLVDVKNVDKSPHTVTIASSQISNPYVTVEKIDFFASPTAATPVGTLDFKATNPSATLVGIPAGGSYQGRLTFALASGAGANTVQDTRSITTTLSS